MHERRERRAVAMGGGGETHKSSAAALSSEASCRDAASRERFSKRLVTGMTVTPRASLDLAHHDRELRAGGVSRTAPWHPARRSTWPAG